MEPPPPGPDVCLECGRKRGCDATFRLDVCCVAVGEDYCGSLVCSDCFTKRCKENHKESVVETLGCSFKLSEIKKNNLSVYKELEDVRAQLLSASVRANKKEDLLNEWKEWYANWGWEENWEEEGGE